ncbi:hypothetical protein EDB83DRAFT_1831851 [Lactarius deliciosus]|nr:hypothetical protein EDB83DRAFT_1831851 [Lactarius deliciosus]
MPDFGLFLLYLLLSHDRPLFFFLSFFLFLVHTTAPVRVLDFTPLMRQDFFVTNHAGLDARIPTVFTHTHSLHSSHT